MLGGNETGVWWAAHSPESILDVLFVCLFFLQTLVISLKTMHNACSPIQQFVSLFVCVKFRAHTSGRWGEPSAGCSKSVEWMVIVDKNKKTNKKKKNMSSVLFFRVSSGRVTLISKHDGVHLSLKINSAMFILSPHPSEFIWTAASGPYQLYKWTNSRCK